MGQGTLRRPARNLVPIGALMAALAACGSAAPTGKDDSTFTLVRARVSTDEIGPIGWKG